MQDWFQGQHSDTSVISSLCSSITSKLFSLPGSDCIVSTAPWFYRLPFLKDLGFCSVSKQWISTTLQTWSFIEHDLNTLAWWKRQNNEIGKTSSKYHNSFVTECISITLCLIILRCNCKSSDFKRKNVFKIFSRYSKNNKGKIKNGRKSQSLLIKAFTFYKTGNNYIRELYV